MKPILLKIKGLNSFLEEQVIDFEKLTEKGLFGIFGHTGSGKSSILDAITLAMYGEISRASKNDKGFINANTDSAIVSLKFEIGEGSKRKTYIVERAISKDKNGAYKTKIARLLSLEGNAQNVIAERSEVNKSIENILGLGIDDFTRSVVLPQGKFSEFLKLTGAERRNMLERIFNLEKYGRELTEKVRIQRNKKITEENKLLGELKAYEGVSEEIIDELALEIHNLSENEKSLKDKKALAEETFKKYKEVWDIQQELNKYEKEMILLENEKETYERNKNQVEKGIKANGIKIFIDEIENTDIKINRNQAQLVINERNKNSLEEIVNKHKEQYSKAELDKNNKTPDLIVKQSELNQVLEIMTEIQKLISEKNAYADQYKGLLEKIKISRAKEEQLKESKNKLTSILEKNESYIISNRTEVDFKNTLIKAIEVEKEYENKQNEISELDKEIDNKSKQILILEESLKTSNEEVTMKNYALNKVKENLSSLKNPGDVTSLNELHKKFLEEKLQLNKLKEMIEEKKKLQNNLDDKAHEKNIKALDRKTLEEELKTLKVELEKLELEIKKLLENSKASILAENLKEGAPCPVCGSTNHIHLAKEIDNSLINEKETLISQLDIKVEQLNKELNKVNIDLAQIEAIETSINSQLTNLSEVDITKNVAKEMEEIFKKEDQLKLLELEIKKYNEEKEVLNNKILSFTNDLGKAENNRASLKSKLEAEIKNKSEIESKLKEKKISLEIKKYEYFALKEELKLDNLKEKMLEISKKEKEIEHKEKENQKYKSEISSIEENIENIINIINISELKRQEIETLGKSVAEKIKEKEEFCKKKYHGENPEKKLEEIKDELSNIETNYNLSKKNYEDSNNNLVDLSKEIEGQLRELNTLKDIKNQQQNKLKDSLDDNGFVSTDEVKIYYIDITKLQQKQTLIKEYEEKLTITKSNIVRLNSQLNGEKINEETYKIAETKLNEVAKTLNEVHDSIINKNHILNEMKEKFNKCNQLLAEKKKVSEKLELIRQIDSLIQGNRFVEYVAKYQLKYIAKEASKRLRAISRDRYALEIDDEGNFVIVDDNNGGERRSTSTLSGGETFLASLALALALSSQIQLKGSAPLEFFFLDEGFGTLDPELLDIVMNSLERLHNSKLSIGIISHVEDLKQRIPVKLIVTPAKPGEGGTKVKIDF